MKRLIALTILVFFLISLAVPFPSSWASDPVVYDKETGGQVLEVNEESLNPPSDKHPDEPEDDYREFDEWAGDEMKNLESPLSHEVTMMSSERRVFSSAREAIADRHEVPVEDIFIAEESTTCSRSNGSQNCVNNVIYSVSLAEGGRNHFRVATSESEEGWTIGSSSQAATPRAVSEDVALRIEALRNLDRLHTENPSEYPQYELWQIDLAVSYEDLEKTDDPEKDEVYGTVEMIDEGGEAVYAFEENRMFRVKQSDGRWTYYDLTDIQDLIVMGSEYKTVIQVNWKGMPLAARREWFSDSRIEYFGSLDRLRETDRTHALNETELWCKGISCGTRSLHSTSKIFGVLTEIKYRDGRVVRFDRQGKTAKETFPNNNVVTYGKLVETAGTSDLPVGHVILSRYKNFEGKSVILAGVKTRVDYRNGNYDLLMNYYGVVAKFKKPVDPAKPGQLLSVLVYDEDLAEAVDRALEDENEKQYAEAMIAAGKNSLADVPSDSKTVVRNYIEEQEARLNGAVRENQAPTAGAITVASGVDVDPNTSGIQVREGTSVEYKIDASDADGDTLHYVWSYTITGSPASYTFQEGDNLKAITFPYDDGTANKTYVWKVVVTDGHNHTVEKTLNVQILPKLTVVSFADILIQSIESEAGQPIHGFVPLMFLRVFPGMKEEDFDGVQAERGTYRFTNGQLTFERDDDLTGMILSNYNSITRTGMNTLVSRISTRLQINVDSQSNVDLILQKLRLASQPAVNQAPVVGSMTVASGVDVDPDTAGIQVREGTSVEYKVEASDADGDTLHYVWSYTMNGGVSYVFQEGDNLKAITFPYGDGTANKTYVWKVVVTDGQNHTLEKTLNVQILPPLEQNPDTVEIPEGLREIVAELEEHYGEGLGARVSFEEELGEAALEFENGVATFFHDPIEDKYVVNFVSAFDEDFVDFYLHSDWPAEEGFEKIHAKAFEGLDPEQGPYTAVVNLDEAGFRTLLRDSLEDSPTLRTHLEPLRWEDVLEALQANEEDFEADPIQARVIDLESLTQATLGTFLSSLMGLTAEAALFIVGGKLVAYKTGGSGGILADAKLRGLLERAQAQIFLHTHPEGGEPGSQDEQQAGTQTHYLRTFGNSGDQINMAFNKDGILRQVSDADLHALLNTLINLQLAGLDEEKALINLEEFMAAVEIAAVNTMSPLFDHPEADPVAGQILVYKQKANGVIDRSRLVRQLTVASALGQAEEPVDEQEDPDENTGEDPEDDSENENPETPVTVLMLCTLDGYCIKAEDEEADSFLDTIFALDETGDYTIADSDEHAAQLALKGFNLDDIAGCLNQNGVIRCLVTGSEQTLLAKTRPNESSVSICMKVSGAWVCGEGTQQDSDTLLIDIAALDAAGVSRSDELADELAQSKGITRDDITGCVEKNGAASCLVAKTDPVDETATEDEQQKALESALEGSPAASSDRPMGGGGSVPQDESGDETYFEWLKRWKKLAATAYLLFSKSGRQEDLT